MTTLYLTQQAQLSAEHGVLLNRIAEELRVPFTRCITELGKGRESDMDWWVSELSSRNTYTNPLFIECCYLVLVHRLLQQGAVPTEIVLDSRALYHALAPLVHGIYPAIRLVLRQRKKEALKDVLKPFVNYAQTVLHFFKQWRASRANRENYAPPQKEITLVDTFVFANSFPNGCYNDRYYDGFAGALSSEERDALYYTPTFIDVNDYNAVFCAMENAPEHFLPKENFLALGDYLYALAYPFRTLVQKPAPVQLLGLDITPLVQQVWYKYMAQYSSMDALLKERFAKRLAERGVRVRLVVDWFENQIIDKGFTAGVRRWLPKVPVVGYQIGIEHKFYLCYYPTSQEYHSKVLPHSIGITGKGFCEPLKEMCDELSVEIAPAFRYRHIWNERQHVPEAGFFTVLLALPITLNDGNDVLHTVAEVARLGMPDNVRFWVKHHPSWTEQKIRESFGAAWPKAFTFVQGGFQECVEQADVVVGSNSSTLLETIVKGIPVFIVGSRSGLTQNPIPASFPTELWRVCTSGVELRDALLAYRARTDEERARHEEMGQSTRDEYFEPVTVAATRRFLQLPVALPNRNTE